MEKENIFLEEEQNLERVKKIIQDKITSASEKFADQSHTIIGFKEGQRGTQFTRQALMSMYATEENELRAIENNPYFGRFDFGETKSAATPIYVGKKTVFSDTGAIVVTDWRTPICSLYYDYGIGQVSYEAHGKTISGEVTEKRQIVIKDGKLVTVKRQDILSDDSILISYLNDNNDARLKSIVATIQREQNKIIRGPLGKNNIVQGVAGSGKTTVALHRISYLLFAESKNIHPSEILIIGPNNYFLEYISTMLPELDIKNVSQTTFEDIARESLKYKGKYKSKTDVLKDILAGKISEEAVHAKSSIEFMDLLNEFVINYILNHLQEPLTYEGITLCNPSEFASSLSTNMYGMYKTYGERVTAYTKTLGKKLKEYGSSNASKYWALNKKYTLSLPKESTERKEELARQAVIEEEFRKGCPKAIKEYFKFLKVKPIDLYTAFISSLGPEYDYIKIPTLANLNQKIISDDDLAALMTINNCLNGVTINNDISSLIIDEAQDISPAQYYLLRQMYPQATFDIYGDINQSIFTYQSFSNWDELNTSLFNGKAQKLDLSKTYRTTRQISDTSNLILEETSAEPADCVARDGEAIKVNYTDQENLALTIATEIKELIEKGSKSIAIITKDDSEALILSKQLKKYGLNINVIDNKSTEYNEGVCIIPSYSSKGLEFDSVIISDASNLSYSTSKIDMKLLYVAITRAMQNLIINSTGELNKALKPLENVDKPKTLKYPENP